MLPKGICTIRLDFETTSNVLKNWIRFVETSEVLTDRIVLGSWLISSNLHALAIAQALEQDS
jgi:hypothetical protein